MSSDVTWLPNSVRKGIDVPKVIYEPVNNLYSGYYTNGTEELVIVEEQDRVPSAIAHEYCHYLQFTRNDIPQGGGLDLFEKFSYNKAIRLYFRTMWWEMEALLFEYKHCPSELNKFWLHGLVLPERFQEDLEM